MNIGDKFNRLAIISSVVCIMNFIISDKSLNAIVMLIFGLGAIIWYTVYAKKKYIVRYVELNNKINNQVEELSDSYEAVKRSVTDMNNAIDEEREKMSEMTVTLDNTSGMVIRNKENTRQASQLAINATEAAIKGTAQMEEMMVSINEIKSLSDDIRKIIKVIDDIAFQTNILALNAAVEAARAGEAGKGFAVVADEVRTLAQKSAEAAKNTSSIIEKNIRSAENGVVISEKVNQSLTQINDEVHKVSELISEITASSEEQADEVIATQNYLTGLNSLVKLAYGAKLNYDRFNEKIGNKFESTFEVIGIVNGTIDDVSEDENSVSIDDDLVLDNTDESIIDMPESVNEEKTIKYAASRKSDETVMVLKSKELERIDEIVNQENAKANTSSFVKKSDEVDSSVKSNAEKILPLDDNDGF